MKSRLLVIIVFLLYAPVLFAQLSHQNMSRWADSLARKDDFSYSAFLFLDGYLSQLDTTSLLDQLDELEMAGKSKNSWFQSQFLCLKARKLGDITYTRFKDREKVKQVQKPLLDSAIRVAYWSQNDEFIAFISSKYAKSIDEIGPMVMYMMNSVNLQERIRGAGNPSDYQFLASILYRVGEYKDCVMYGQKGVAAWNRWPPSPGSHVVSCTNTVALGFHRQKIYDSAMQWYGKAMQLAEQVKDTLWIGIIWGNMGQILYEQHLYDSAYLLFKKDFSISNEQQQYDIAANTLQWAARTSLALGNTATALNEVRYALQIIQRSPDAFYQRNIYYTATEVFKKLKTYDSAFYYNQLYIALNDSLDRLVSANSLSISRARINDEASRYQIQQLSQEKKAAVYWRNTIVAFIILLVLLALLQINRTRLKATLKIQAAEQEKQLLAQEVALANERLSYFTTAIIQKTGLIEQLEQQLQTSQNTPAQQDMMELLISQAILTEEDWLEFKRIFELVHPGFFARLREKIIDITPGEQRIAALTRLQLTTRQMAAMLGISPNSVVKAKQRLRQRSKLDTDYEVEALLAGI